jgi:transcriptional regulator with XRE-family HTH domain
MRARLERMSPDDLKALRRDLSCTAKELAAALGLDQKTVLAWEKGELFPTKQYIDKMEELRAKGTSSIPKKSKGAGPFAVLADAAAWELIRKILANKKLRDDCAKLAAGYPDPKDDGAP